VKGLEGKRVVVTGGTSGIGAATVQRFREEGAHVVSLAIDDGEDNIVCDVADAEQVQRAFDQIGTLDVLVANAGVSIRAPFVDIREEDWQRVLDVNLGGVFRCAQQAARRMDKGVIHMTASTNGLTGHENYADYNASKAGVILLARTMARELAPRIRVNAVCPGYVLTPMQRAEYTDEMLAAVNEGIPLKRHAEPEEIAALFAFLASDDARYITGAAIAIDGGETA
jgi:NAD(P)-dependent dehydrogenase (short-subunit alcohol dehydrogenase family)